MKTIFDSTTIGSLLIKNRVAAASVGRNLADIDGHIPEGLYDIYKELAEGGTGLIISEMTMVSLHDYPVSGFNRLQDDTVIPEYKELTDMVHQADSLIVPFPVSWTVKMKKKQKETQDILSYHSQAAGCSDKTRAKASGGRQPIEECGRTGL